MKKNFTVAKATVVRNGESIVLSLHEAVKKNIFTVNGEDYSAVVCNSANKVMYVPSITNIKVGDNIQIDTELFVSIEREAVNSDGEKFKYTQLVTREQHERWLAKQQEVQLG